MEYKNSRYEIRKYYATYADTREEAYNITNPKRKEYLEAKWQEIFEIIDWGEEEKATDSHSEE